MIQLSPVALVEGNFLRLLSMLRYQGIGIDIKGILKRVATYCEGG